MMYAFVTGWNECPYKMRFWREFSDFMRAPLGGLGQGRDVQQGKALRLILGRLARPAVRLFSQ